MRNIRLAMLLFLIMFSIVAPGSTASPDYTIRPGDVLAVGVWGHEELQLKEVVVRPDGKFTFPLIGELSTAGMTVSQVTTSMTDYLSEYIKNPKVTINILKFGTTRIYVLGEVNKPGLYEIDREHRVLDAIGIAGSYTKDAAKKNIFVIRKDKTDQPQRIDLLRLLKNGDMSQNLILNEGDVLYVTKNNRIDFARDILPIISGAYYINHFNDK